MYPLLLGTRVMPLFGLPVGKSIKKGPAIFSAAVDKSTDFGEKEGRGTFSERRDSQLLSLHSWVFPRSFLQ